MENCVSSYGYIAILLGTFFEGETILIIAGFLAHRGYLELPFVVAAAFTGTLPGDQLYFYLGRIKWEAFLNGRHHWKSKSTKVLKLMDKHQALHFASTVIWFFINGTGAGMTRPHEGRYRWECRPLFTGQTDRFRSQGNA